MSLAPILLAERAVPRYTSYPTAPHFTADVGLTTYAEWLAALPPAAHLSLYLHVPFCHELCLYCGCHTKAVRRSAPVAAYAAALRAEIALVGASVGRHRVSHLHWGGGTPSMLGPDRLLALADALGRHFDLSAIGEHAIELDPRHVDAALARALARIGVNRASLGVQDFSPHVQAAIGRIQPYDTVARAVGMLRDAGVGAINFDLMYGLPQQSVADVRATMEKACALAPQRISLFGYAHVPWFKKQQRLIDAASLPGAGERLKQMEAARAQLIASGYEAVGFDHFALPDDPLAQAARAGTLRRNFQGYTTDGAPALIGLGASAIGKLPQGYAQNAPDVGNYARAVETGQFATARGIALSEEDRARADIIKRLMCDLRIDLGSRAFRYAAELESLAPLAAEGLVEIGAQSVAVTDRGRPFVRLVAAAFDSYLAAGRAAHSRAV